MNTNTFSKHITLRTAMLVALGVTSSLGQAASIVDGTAFEYAYELRDASTMDITVPTGLVIPVASGRSIYKGLQPYYITMTLKGGAVFKAEPPGAGTPTCDCKDNAAVACTIEKQNAIAGLNTWVYVVTAGASDGTTTKMNGGTCTLPAFSVTLTSGADKSYEMDVSISQVEPGSPTFSQKKSGPFISFKQAFTLSTQPVDTVIDVGGTVRSTDFALGANVQETILANATLGDTKVRVARIGSLVFQNASKILSLAGAEASANDVIGGSIKLVVSGLPLVAATDTVSATHSGRIFLAPIAMNAATKRCLTSGAKDDAALGHAAQELAAAASQAASNNVVTFDLGDTPRVFSAGAANDGVWNGIDVCFIASGKLISKGVVTIEASGGGKANFALVDGKLGTVKRNGTSVKVLNISPDPISGGKDVTFIRIYNMEDSRTATVYGTLYNQSGTVIGGKDNFELVTIEPKAVAAVTRDVLVTKLGLSSTQPWTGRAWMQVESDSPKTRVQVLMRSNGTLISLGERVMADGECLYRSDTTLGSCQQ